MYEGMDRLFGLRVRLNPYHDPSKVDAVACITAWDGGFQAPNHTRIDVRLILRWTENGKRRSRTIFKRGATWCATPGVTDGPEARELVLSLFAMKPGDTDEDYFASYTPAQLIFATRYSDDLTCEAQARYCDENGNVRR